MSNVIDPIEFANMFWPSVRWYKQQVEIIESVRDTKFTFVPAGNKLG